MIIANFKSNVINFDRWGDDFVNSCLSLEFFVGIAPPSIYIYKYSNVIKHLSNQDELNHDMSEMAIGAQDVDHSSGSRTGAISIEMLEELDSRVEFVIIGQIKWVLQKMF